MKPTPFSTSPSRCLSSPFSNIQDNTLPPERPYNTDSVEQFCRRAFSNDGTIQWFKSAMPVMTTRDLTALTESGNYIPVLKELWKDTISLESRRQWLRSQNQNLHAPLLAEQAVVEYRAADSCDKARVLQEVSLPLLGQAVFRAKQDGQCSFDPSVYYAEKGAHELYQVYWLRLDKEVGHRDSAVERIDLVVAAVKEAAEKTLQEGFIYPSPNWVGKGGNFVQRNQLGSGFDLLHIPDGANMCDPCTHDQRRKAYAAWAVSTINKEGWENFRFW